MNRRQFGFGLAASSFALRAGGFEPIFNGKDLSGWTLVKGRGPGYVVENGVLVCPKEGGGNLFTEKEYGDFVLRMEWRLWDGGNNGVGIRSPLAGDAAYLGMEIQILDEMSDEYQKKMQLKPTQYTGSVYDLFAAKPGHVKRDGVWNAYEIEAKGKRIRVKLNGHWINDADLSTVKDQAVLKKHPGVLRDRGHIGLLGHGTRVEFRKLMVKEI
jgi:hypothetical protein